MQQGEKSVNQGANANLENKYLLFVIYCTLWAKYKRNIIRNIKQMSSRKKLATVP